MKVSLLLLICLPIAFSSLSENFYKWIHENFGEEMARRLNRTDLGEEGSFGGGGHKGGTKTRKERPKQSVIFVHGEGESAGSYESHRKKFLDLGFNESELYATTYGSGKSEDIHKEPMKCEYVKQVRDMIKVVSNYTNSPVSVIAYSMGSPIARKAILGGKCVDGKKEDLGEPLTKKVGYFLSVAGANRGYSLCSEKSDGICSALNGLSCKSKFLEDINFKTDERYEGRAVASVYSKKDEVVGYKGCEGKTLSRINHALINFQINGKTHNETIFDTIEMQFAIAYASGDRPERD